MNMLRLNLGCGGDILDGYTNIDREARGCRVVKADFRNLGGMFQPGSVHEVRMIHSFGYLRPWEADEVLVAIFNVLKPGGQLIMELPDLDKIVSGLYTGSQSRGELVRAIYGYGHDDIAGRVAYPPYCLGWGGNELVHLLGKIGFVNITIKSPQTHGQREWRDTRIEAARP